MALHTQVMMRILDQHCLKVYVTPRVLQQTLNYVNYVETSRRRCHPGGPLPLPHTVLFRRRRGAVEVRPPRVHPHQVRHIRGLRQPSDGSSDTTSHSVQEEERHAAQDDVFLMQVSCNGHLSPVLEFNQLINLCFSPTLIQGKRTAPSTWLEAWSTYC